MRPSQARAVSLADRVWEQNKRDVIDNWPPPSLDAEESDQRWTDISIRCHRRFESLIGAPNRCELIRRFVRRFGREGDEVDFAWLISFYDGMVDHAPRFASVYRGIGRAERVWREAQLHVAEAQTRLFLEDTRLLRRYSQVFLWCGALRGLKSSICVAAIRKRIGSEEYWWYARNFLVMADLTGRNDLLAGSKAEELQRAFRAWLRWYRQSGGYLRFHPKQKRWLVNADKQARLEVYVPFVRDLELPPYPPPRYPFPNWKGREPCSPKLLEELW